MPRRQASRRTRRRSPGWIIAISCLRGRRASGLSTEERTKQCLKEEKPILDVLLAWADSIFATPKSVLCQALHYLDQQRPYLLRHMEDGQQELSDKRAERSIKPFVIEHKNFLFANTPLGAQASTMIYSLIEAAKKQDWIHFAI